MIYDYVVVGSSFGALGCITGLLKSKKKILCFDGSQIPNNNPKDKDEYDFDFTKQNIPIFAHTQQGLQIQLYPLWM